MQLIQYMQAEFKRVQKKKNGFHTKKTQLTVTAQLSLNNSKLPQCLLTF